MLKLKFDIVDFSFEPWGFNFHGSSYERRKKMHRYKVVRIGYGPSMEKYPYSRHGKRYVDVMDNETKDHYIFPSYYELGYSFNKTPNEIKEIYDSSIKGQNEHSGASGDVLDDEYDEEYEPEDEDVIWSQFSNLDD